MLRPCKKCRSKFGCKEGDGKLYCLRCSREVETQKQLLISTIGTPIELTEIPALIETLSGKAPSRDSVKRWIRDGYRGVRLRVAGPLRFRFTCREWVEEFMVACGSVGHEDRTLAAKSEEESARSEIAYEVLQREFGIRAGRK